MANLKKAEIRRVLSAIRNQRAKEDGKATIVNRSLAKDERAAGKLLTAWMRKSGFDTKALAVLQRRHRDELDRALEKQRKADAKRKSRRLDFAHASVANQARTIQQFAALGGFFPFPSFTLQRPTVILAEPDIGIITDSRIEPFESFAKVRLDTKRPGIHKLNFVYQTSNDTNRPVIIDAVTFLSASGRLHLTESGSFPPFSVGSIDVKSQIEVLALTQPPTSVNREIKLLRSMIAISNVLFIDGNESVDLSAAEQMAATQCIIPAQTGVLIVVSLIMDCDFHPGRAVVDLSTGNFQVRCPLVVVSVRGQLQVKPSSVI